MDIYKKSKAQSILEKHIDKLDSIHEKKEAEQTVLEEQKLRGIIRDLIKETKEEHYFDNTGINKLAKLFKKTQMLTTLKDGFKTLRSGKEQRDSFRAHIINGIENLLQPYRNMLGDEGIPADQPALGEGPLEEQEEEGVTLDMSDEDKMIGDDGLPAKAAEEEEAAPDPEEKEREDFTVPGYDKTADQRQGRTDALTAFKNVNKQIEEMYIDIESQDDREMFYDWLLTNMKLYFDQWEEETETNVQEPTTDEYEQQAQTPTETEPPPPEPEAVAENINSTLNDEAWL